jgi:hypothetical protein
MGTIRLSAAQFAAADQSCAAANAVAAADDVGDYATAAQLSQYASTPNTVYAFDATGETPSLQPGAD